MARRRRRNYMDEEDINLTPLLDVIFNLLFFFVLATTVKQDENFFEVSLPQAGDAPVTEPSQLLPEVFVGSDGAISLNGKAVPEDQFVQQLAGELKTLAAPRAILSADGSATVQQTVNAMEQMRAAGVEEILQRVQVGEK